MTFISHLLGKVPEGQRLFVTLIPYTSFREDAGNITAANIAIKRLSERKGADVIDINPLLCQKAHQIWSSEIVKTHIAGRTTCRLVATAAENRCGAELQMSLGWANCAVALRRWRRSKAWLLVLTTMAKPMNAVAVCGVTQGNDQGRDGRMAQIGPKGSRHQRILWTAQKIAQLTGDTEGGAYRMLLIALIDAEGIDVIADK
jgi:hypothetical protein